jgi:hypothetical protein
MRIFPISAAESVDLKSAYGYIRQLRNDRFACVADAAMMSPVGHFERFQSAIFRSSTA